MLNWQERALGTDQANRQDLLLFLPVETSQHVTNLRTTITGTDGLEATADPNALTQATPQLETRTYPNDSGPTAADYHHIANGWVARIPITLSPTRPWDVGGDRYPLAIAATYDVDGKPRTLNVHGAIEARVRSALPETAFAASIFPLICLGAAFTRWRRTR